MAGKHHQASSGINIEIPRQVLASKAIISVHLIGVKDELIAKFRRKSLERAARHNFLGFPADLELSF